MWTYELKKRKYKIRVVWNGQVSTNSFVIWQFWEREVELEFEDWGTLPYWDIDREVDKVSFLLEADLETTSS